jgi:hypothetical protein
MSALITAYDCNGNKIGSCDATCYNATKVKSQNCKCICRGSNHGAGYQKAIQNIHALNGEWLHHGVLRSEISRFEVEEQLILRLDVSLPCKTSPTPIKSTL